MARTSTNCTDYSRPRAGADLPSVGSELSPRELEVLEQVARGLTNAEVGEWLGMKEGTVKVHVWACLLKLGLRNRVELTLWFHKLPVERAA